jgi:hypothetical protein
MKDHMELIKKEIQRQEMIGTLDEVLLESHLVANNDSLSDKEKNDKLDELLDYVERFKAGVVALRNGGNWEDISDEIFLERKSEQKQVEHKLGRAMEHLLKIAYCASDAVYEQCKYVWIKDYLRPKREVEELLGWGGHHEDKNLIKYCNDELQNIYEWAINVYKKACKEYPDLKDGLSKIPEKCPWTLNDLMDNTINELILVLPDVYRTEY